MIKRAFADLAHGQMHYRHAGDGPPLLILHMSPGSSRQHIGLLADLADANHVVAPDTPGNGDSPALPLEIPQITDLAEAMRDFLDALGLDRITLYGSHTGAAIAAELAILAPDRIERLILDGVQLLTVDERAEALDRYAHPFTPDLDGAYLARAFQFCRDQFLFYPWYDRSRASRRTSGLPDPATLHAMLTEVLKAGDTYHRNYHAAFRWDAVARLRLLDCPVLMLAAEDDPLFANTASLAAVPPDARFVPLPRFDAPLYPQARKAAIRAFQQRPARRVSTPPR